MDVKGYCNVFGEQTYRRWLDDGKILNAEGTINLANWIKDAILAAGYLNDATPLTSVNH